MIGEDGLERLRNACAAVYGLGGVGGYVFEALVRAGVGRLYVVDGDCIEPSNINRQLLALDVTVGTRKVDAARERAMHINPDAVVVPVFGRITPDNADRLVPEDAQYAVDAIDTIDAKAALLLSLLRRDARFVSCMGAARRMDPGAVRVADIREVSGCPLARRVRVALKKQGVIGGIRCVFSTERPVPVSNGDGDGDPEDGIRRKRPQGSLSYVPGIIGLTAAGLIIQDMLSGLGRNGARDERD